MCTLCDINPRTPERPFFGIFSPNFQGLFSILLVCRSESFIEIFQVVSEILAVKDHNNDELKLSRDMVFFHVGISFES